MEELSIINIRLGHTFLLAVMYFVGMQSLTAQVVLNFDPSKEIGMSINDKAFFQTWLPENDYKGDTGYYGSLLDNAFFDSTASSATIPIALQQMNNGVPVRNNYFGIATWATTAQFDNVVITDANGNNIYKDDFQNLRNEWNQNGGTWLVENGVMKQTDIDNLGSINVCYHATGHDANLEMDATKISGAEGFLIAFSYIDSDNFVWWNIGGWANSQHAIEQCVDGKKTLLATTPGSIQTNKTYHIKVEMKGQQVRCYIDDELVHEIQFDDSHTIYATATISEDLKDLDVRVANPGEKAQNVVVRLRGADINKAIQTKMSLNGNFNSHALDNLVVGTTQKSNLTIVQEYAFSFNAPARSLNTISVSADGNTVIDDISDVGDDASEGVYNAVDRSKTGIFDIAGRRYDISSKNIRPGLYIIDGQKVVIR